jgi:hypothetical protein
MYIWGFALKPDGGEVRIEGCPVLGRNPTPRRTGYQLRVAGLYTSINHGFQFLFPFGMTLSLSLLQATFIPS